MSFLNFIMIIHIALLFIIFEIVCGFERDFMPIAEPENPNLYEQPLFLTPFLRLGQIEKARRVCRVGNVPSEASVPSFSGFFTVNSDYNSNIFFWFVPATNKNNQAPIILWLQGGPGTTGLFGFFVEHGPFIIFPNMTAGLRKYAWTKAFHVIYVDNPVGAGFSFTKDPKGYVTNENDMAKDMYDFMHQFFTVFYEYRNNDFYIVGESYGGKYVPALAYKIHKEGNSSKINFKGMAIGNGMCDPESMMDYSDYLYQLGLIDRRQAAIMSDLSNTIVKHIREKKYYKALIGLNKLIIDFNVLPYISYFKNYTNYDFFYNFLLTETPDAYDYFRTFVQKPEIRKAIHVGNLTFQDGSVAQKHLLMDIMKSVKSKVAVIMDNYRVMFFNGQLDLVIPYPLTVNFLHTVKWKHSKEYMAAERLIWRLDGSEHIAGYVHNVKKFYEVLVRNAGHILPYDQPKVAFDLISRFVNKRPFA